MIPVSAEALHSVHFMSNIGERNGGAKFLDVMSEWGQSLLLNLTNSETLHKSQWRTHLTNSLVSSASLIKRVSVCWQSGILYYSVRETPCYVASFYPLSPLYPSLLTSFSSFSSSISLFRLFLPFVYPLTLQLIQIHLLSNVRRLGTTN